MGLEVTIFKIALGQVKLVAQHAPGTAFIGTTGAAAVGTGIAANYYGERSEFRGVEMDAGVLALTADALGYIAAVGTITAASVGGAAVGGVGMFALGFALFVAYLNPEVRAKAYELSDQFEKEYHKKFPNGIDSAEDFAKLVDVFKDTYHNLGIDPNTGANFTAAEKFVPRKDPLTLDLNGNGLETVGADPLHPIFFDHEGDGILSSTGWVKPSDGFLVLDRNGNGLIDNGTELFGDSTPVANGTAANGFAALLQEDTNADGVVKASDERWNELRVWQDLNQDGISQQNELSTLTQLGIESISVAEHTNRDVLQNGNQIANLGTFTFVGGTMGTLGEVGQLADIDLVQNTFLSHFANAIPLIEEAKSIPQLTGSGAVRNLREAASLQNETGAELRAAINAMMTEPTREGRKVKLAEVVLKWGATCEMPTSIETATLPSRIYTEVGNTPTTGTVHYSDTTAIEIFAQVDPVLYAKITALEQFNGRNILGGFVQQVSFSSVSALDGDYVVSLFAEQKALVEAAYEARECQDFCVRGPETFPWRRASPSAQGKSVRRGGKVGLHSTRSA